MEDRTYQRVAAIIIVAAILGIAVYGSYLPMRKAQMFIATLQALQTQQGQATSLTDLESKLSAPLNEPSPIGQEELVRNMANSVLSFVQQSTDATSTAALIGYLNSYYDPILSQGKGMSFGQDLYLEGAINEIAFAQTGSPTYLAAAQKWYSESVALGPNRPQSLYGLFDVYRAENDTTNTIAIGTTIVHNWPTDTRIEQAMALYEVMKNASVTVVSSTKK
jgi:hypothetical protein